MVDILKKVVAFFETSLGKYVLILLGALLIYILVFRGGDKTNKPKVVGIATPHSMVNIDQRSKFEKDRLGLDVGIS